MTKHTGKQIFVRLSDDLVAELDRYVEVLAREQPGLHPSRSDAIRVLLHKGLATIQTPEPPLDPQTQRPAARRGYGPASRNGGGLRWEQVEEWHRGDGCVGHGSPG